MQKSFSKFNPSYLSNFHSIFFEFSICYSWDIALPMVYWTLFILTKVSQLKLWSKLFCQKFSCLRVMSLGIEFWKKLMNFHGNALGAVAHLSLVNFLLNFSMLWIRHLTTNPSLKIHCISFHRSSMQSWWRIT